MGLFSDIYNTVAKFFRPQEVIEGDASKSVATNRLKLVLMQDRTNLTPKILEQMRGEMVDLLSKYLEMDKDLLELNFEQEGDQIALMLSIPVIRAKDEEEIEAAINASKEETESDDTDDESDEEQTESEDFSDEDEEVIETESNSEEKDVTEENVAESDAPKRKRKKKIIQEDSQVEENQEAEDVEETVES